MNAVNQELIFRAAVPYLRPATQYEFWVTGFTQKREGVSSPVLRTRTDTAKPGPPVITNTNCTGAFIHALFVGFDFPKSFEGFHIGKSSKTKVAVFGCSSISAQDRYIEEKHNVLHSISTVSTAFL